MARQVRATEEWVREKAELSSVRSDEVETLSLHGSYHEKIVSLGNSLLNFKRLKSLDLSRNAIVSLEGLESLQELEQLSLYFNNIQTLEQVSSLSHLMHLTELDLRLNPVTSTEGNYRQYVIHLLPNLLKLDLRPVRTTERNPAQFEFVSHVQYETSEADKTEESQQMKKLFSNDTDEQSYLNGAQMCKWDGAANIQSDLRAVPATERNATKYGFISQNQYETSEVDKREESQQMKVVFGYETDRQNYVNQSDVTTTTNYRSCKSIDEDNSTSIRRSGMLSTSQIPQNGTSTAHHLVDGQQLLSPSNSLTSLRTTCSKRSFIDRKETEHSRSEQNQIHPSEDVTTTTKYRSCSRFDEDDSTSIRRSGMLPTSQIPHNGTSTTYHLVDEQQLLSPRNSLTSLRTTCSKRRFTDRKETEHSGSEQNQIHPSEDDYRNYQSPVRSSFCSAGKNVCHQSREKLRVTFSNEIPIKHNQLSSRGTPEDDSASCLKWRMTSTNQIPHKETSSCDQQNRTSASFTEHINKEITGSKSSEAQSKLTRAHMEYTDKQLEVTKTTGLNSLQPSYNGKETEHLRIEQNKIHPSEDVTTTTKYRNCSRIDEDENTSIRRSGMLSTSQILHNAISTAHHLVDEQQLLSPSNSLTSLRTTCSKRSFTDRKEIEHSRSELNQIHPSEGVTTTTKYRSCRRFDEDDSSSIRRSGMLSTSQIPHNATSTAHHLVDGQQLLSPSNSLTSLRTTCSKRSFTDRKETEHLRREQNKIHPSEDVSSTTKYRNCSRFDEDDSTSIRRSGMLSTSQISHNATSTAHRLVDRQKLLSPSNSLTSLHTTCSKRSFTDRKETEYLRNEQNQIHPVEDDYRNYQSPVRSSFYSVGKDVCRQSGKKLRVTFSDEIPIKHNKIGSRSIPEDDSASCLESRMPSTSQMPHKETSFCDQQNRTSASFTEHINKEITGSKSSEAQSKLTRAHMEYTDKQLEVTKTTGLNSLQPSYNGKTAHHNLPGIDQCGDSNLEIPLGLRSGSSANASAYLQNLLDLVDRHWSGSKSLHRNQSFLNSAEELFHHVLDRMAISKIQGLEQRVKELTEESRRLQTRTTSGFDSAEFLRIKRELSQKEDDLESLNGKFAKLVEENNKLHSQLRSLELVNSAGLQQRNEELHRENDGLNLQVKYLKQQIEQHNKLKHVVTMLQESHRAIISSNDYLKELLTTALQRTGISNVLSKDLSRKL